MVSAYECEIRYFIDDIKEFKNRLKKLNAKLLFPYEFTDYYYVPKNEKWDPIRKNLRIRE